MKAYAVSENASERVREEKKIQKMSLEKRLTAVNSLHLGNTTCFFSERSDPDPLHLRPDLEFCLRLRPLYRPPTIPLRPPAAISNIILLNPI